jgi:hypothetical protein
VAEWGQLTQRLKEQGAGASPKQQQKQRSREEERRREQERGSSRRHGSRHSRSRSRSRSRDGKDKRKCVILGPHEPPLQHALKGMQRIHADGVTAGMCDITYMLLLTGFGP